MVLIHVFTYSPGLSLVGEVTAIIFATLFHTTKLKVFELLETTLIAVWVSIHMIKSRGDHWDREEELERDMIGLQLYVEHHNTDGNDKKWHVSEVRRLSSLSRRQSSNLSTSDHENPRTNSEVDHQSENDVEAGGLVQQSKTTNMSSFTTASRRTKINTANEGGSSTTHWWHHFFDHFLDGSAGVMYTSFLGLIIDEIVNIDSSEKY